MKSGVSNGEIDGLFTASEREGKGEQSGREGLRSEARRRGWLWKMEFRQEVLTRERLRAQRGRREGESGNGTSKMT